MAQPNSLENPQLNNSPEAPKTPEELTASFFSQNYDVIATALEGKVLANALDPQQSYVIVEGTRGYSRTENEGAKGPEVSHYKAITEGVIQPGQLYVAESKRNPNGRLLLIPALDGDTVGACVAIEAAQIAHPKKGTEVTKVKSAIATALDVPPGEYQLEIRDQNAEVIYIMLPQSLEASPDDESVSDANAFFDQL